MNESEAWSAIYSGIETNENINMGEPPYHEVMLCAEKALLKQIPQKPVQSQGFPRWGYCPSCGKTVTKHSSYVGCTWCLQALDWSEV